MRKVYIASPVATQSGYGHHAREIITNIIEQKKEECQSQQCFRLRQTSLFGGN